jgi:hypothetical protein
VCGDVGQDPEGEERSGGLLQLTHKVNRQDEDGLCKTKTVSSPDSKGEFANATHDLTSNDGDVHHDLREDERGRAVQRETLVFGEDGSTLETADHLSKTEQRVDQ